MEGKTKEKVCFIAEMDLNISGLQIVSVSVLTSEFFSDSF